MVVIALSAGCADQPTLKSQYFAVDNPKKLSQWSVIQAHDQALTLAGDAQVYQLASPLFSDYAGKLRTLSLPKGAQVSLDADTERFVYPVGTIIPKHFIIVGQRGVSAQSSGWSKPIRAPNSVSMTSACRR